ncbi:MAG: hypothetical protein WBN30_06795, partial [Polyangiales bacterium]
VAVVETDQDGLLQATVRAPSEPGAYEIVASVDNEDVAREVFIVEQSGDELADLEVAPSELESLVEESGGRLFLGIDDVPPLSELAATTRRAAGLTSKQPLSNPWYIAVIVLLLGATWVLRRRWGRR